MLNKAKGMDDDDDQMKHMYVIHDSVLSIITSLQCIQQKKLVRLPLVLSLSGSSAFATQSNHHKRQSIKRIYQQQKQPKRNRKIRTAGRLVLVDTSLNWYVLVVETNKNVNIWLPHSFIKHLIR